MIVHIIYNDSKFVDNYISFFNTNFSEIEFFFVLYGRGKEGDVEKFRRYRNVIVINNLYSFRKMLKVKKIMKEAQKIIISGIFGIEYFLYLIFNRSIWNKIYLQFWGGDFYQFRDSSKNKTFMFNAIKKCRCLLFGEQDYRILSKIFNIEKKYKTVFAPCYNYDIDQYKSLNLIKKDSNTIGILLGNSASDENQHFDAIDMLSKYKNNNIKVYCPLSYGDRRYANNVANYGNKVLGEKFIPLIDFIEYEKYLKLISSCDIAIYNHNRQQAFGNIMMSLALGLKVFINKKNTLYYDYKELGCHVYDIDEMKSNSYDGFINFSNKEKEQNLRYIEGLKRKVIESWAFIQNSFEK